MQPIDTVDDDRACAIRAQSGDPGAFSALVLRHQKRIYRFLLRLTRSPDDALDLTQDTFFRAYQSLGQWRPEALFTTWLFRIARNAAFDWLRREKRRAASGGDADCDVPDPAAGPERIVETQQVYRLLEAALARLPPDHREVLLLREIEAMSYDEIADVLDIGVGTVKSRIARARAGLLARMQAHLKEAP